MSPYHESPFSISLIYIGVLEMLVDCLNCSIFESFIFFYLFPVTSSQNYLFQLDAAEYDIPIIDYTPTLESILNDIDDHGSLSEDDASGNHLLPQGEVSLQLSTTLILPIA